MAVPKPTLLAFHGSGSNGTIHNVQLARIIRVLRPHFDIEALTAPIPSTAGPGILPFFDGCGPYFRWLPATENLSPANPNAAAPMVPELEKLVRDAVAEVRSKGGYVAGLIGFSQGTRIIAGLFKAAQIRKALLDAGEKAEGLDWLDFKFGLSVCSASPPPFLPPTVIAAVKGSGLAEEKQNELLEMKVNVPTLHVIGNQDQWRWAGKLLVEAVYGLEGDGKSAVEEGKGGFYEFQMGHHYPVKPEDTQKVVEWMLGTWQVLNEAPAP